MHKFLHGIGIEPRSLQGQNFISIVFKVFLAGFIYTLKFLLHLLNVLWRHVISNGYNFIDFCYMILSTYLIVVYAQMITYPGF